MASKESENGVKEFQFHKAEKRTTWESFHKALYDSDKKTCLGRTSKSWGQILLFYSIFYIVLAALFAICMQCLLATLPDNEPKWKLHDSLIGTNPGLGFRPISNRTEEGSLIHYNTRNQTTSARWIWYLNDYLKDYINNQTGSNYVNCDYGQQPEVGKVCKVNLDSFGPCSPRENYGYNTASPCVFLKLNKIYGWDPDYYTSPVAEMPDDLKDAIIRSQSNNKQVWISCYGEGPSDKENLINNFQYYPSRGFPSYYYPYTNTKNYLSPLIAVRVINPTPNIIISIECRAWAKNIKYRGGDLYREGSTHFEIQLDVLNYKNNN